MLWIKKKKAISYMYLQDLAYSITTYFRVQRCLVSKHQFTLLASRCPLLLKYICIYIVNSEHLEFSS